MKKLIIMLLLLLFSTTVCGNDGSDDVEEKMMISSMIVIIKNVRTSQLSFILFEAENLKEMDSRNKEGVSNGGMFFEVKFSGSTYEKAQKDALSLLLKIASNTNSLTSSYFTYVNPEDPYCCVIIAWIPPLSIIKLKPD